MRVPLTPVFKKIAELLGRVLRALVRNWFKIAIVLILLMAFFLVKGHFESQAQRQREIEDREYAATQKAACVDIYAKESDKWNNVNGWRYNEFNDTCYVEYRAEIPKTIAQCDAEYRDEEGEVYTFLLMSYVLCKDGLFEKSF